MFDDFARLHITENLSIVAQRCGHRASSYKRSVDKTPVRWPLAASGTFQRMASENAISSR
jgi:hypothetical protein